MTVSTSKNSNTICEKVWQINRMTIYKPNGVVNITSPLVLSRNRDDKLMKYNNKLFTHADVVDTFGVLEIPLVKKAN